MSLIMCTCVVGFRRCLFREAIVEKHLRPGGLDVRTNPPRSLLGAAAARDFRSPRVRGVWSNSSTEGIPRGSQGLGTGR